MTCRSTVVKIILIGNPRWLPSCLCLLYFPATVLFTYIKSCFFRNQLASKFHIDPTVEMWLRVCSNDHAPLAVMPYIIFFFKIKNCLKVDFFISCDDRTGKMLHNICSGYVTQVSDLWPVGLLFFLYIYIEKFKNLLVRNQWTDFNITWQECFKFVQAVMISKKTWPSGGGLIFPI